MKKQNELLGKPVGETLRWRFNLSFYRIKRYFYNGEYGDVFVEKEYFERNEE